LGHQHRNDDRDGSDQHRLLLAPPINAKLS
jgi:hypothetical protein